MLPTHDALLQEARENLVQPVTFTIPNEHLGKPTEWAKDVPAEARQLLSDALMVDKLENFGQGESDQNFKKFWVDRGGDGRSLTRTSIKASQYFGLLRDHNIITGLLASNGIVYSLDVMGAEARGKFPRVWDRDINWQIQIYEFVVQKNPKVAFYRFVAKAKIKQFELLFPTTTETEAKLAVGISFKQSDATIGILEPNLGGSQEIPIKLEPAREEAIQELKAAGAQSELEAILNFVGGVQLGQVVTSGFLGGTTNASIVSGGLIGGDEIEPIAGVSLEIGRLGDATSGLLFGVGLNDGNSLFLGPSIQYSVLTLSTGARIFDDDDSTKVRPAGVLSVDLSRLIGGKREVTQIELDNSTTGGDWGKASDLIAQDLALVEWTLKSEDINQGFTLRQIADCAGNEINDLSKQARFDLKGKDNLDQQLLFIPRGIYKYEGIEGLTLAESGALINEESRYKTCNALGVRGSRWTF